MILNGSSSGWNNYSSPDTELEVPRSDNFGKLVAKAWRPESNIDFEAVGIITATYNPTLQQIFLDKEFYGIDAPNAVKIDVVISYEGSAFLAWEDTSGRITVFYYPYNQEYTQLTFFGKSPYCAPLVPNASMATPYNDLPPHDIRLVYQRGNRIYYRDWSDSFATETEIPWDGTPVTIVGAGVNSATGYFAVRLKQTDGVLLRVGTKLVGVNDNYVGYPPGVLT